MIYFWTVKTTGCMLLVHFEMVLYNLRSGICKQRREFALILQGSHEYQEGCMNIPVERMLDSMGPGPHPERSDCRTENICDLPASALSRRLKFLILSLG